MKTLGHHLTVRLVEDDWIARDLAARRALTRTLYACGEHRGLLAFRVADNHLHILLECSRETAGAFARVALPALRRVLELDMPFECARIRPMTSSRHLRNAFAYVFEQGRRHGSIYDPAHDGSSLPDLMGLRCLDVAHTVMRVRSALPRLGRAELEGWLGHGTRNVAIEPDLELLHEAASGAVALPHLQRYGCIARAAKVAAISAGQRWWSGREVREALGISRSTHHRLAQSTSSAEFRNAIEAQLLFRTQLAEQSRRAAGRI